MTPFTQFQTSKKSYAEQFSGVYSIDQLKSYGLEKRRCPYAKEIDGTKNMVLCTFKCSHKDSELENSQISNTQFPVSGSPTQINVFDTNPTNNGLPLYGDSSFNDDNISL